MSGQVTAVASPPPFSDRFERRRCSSPRIGDTVTFFRAQRDGPDVIPGPLHRSPRTSTTATSSSTPGRPTRTRLDVIVGDDPAAPRRPGTSPAAGSTPATSSSSPTPRRTPTACWPRNARSDRRRQRPSARGPLRPRLAGEGLGPPTGVAALPGRHRVGQPGRDLHRRPRPVAAAEVDDALPAAGPLPAPSAGLPGQRAGTPLPPNLAGRVAAAFALAAQVDAAGHPAEPGASSRPQPTSSRREDRQRVPRSDVVTALPHAFYPESSWRDDLELGAAELALAGPGARRSRADAGCHARGLAAPTSPYEAGDEPSTCTTPARSPMPISFARSARGRG